MQGLSCVLCIPHLPPLHNRSGGKAKYEHANTLELWDIENLYLYKQLEKDIENSEEKVYYLENYKMRSIETCDYKKY